LQKYEIFYRKKLVFFSDAREPEEKVPVELLQEIANGVLSTGHFHGNIPTQISKITRFLEHYIDEKDWTQATPPEPLNPVPIVHPLVNIYRFAQIDWTQSKFATVPLFPENLGTVESGCQ
jgi:hypothetical protein